MKLIFWQTLKIMYFICLFTICCKYIWRNKFFSKKNQFWMHTCVSYIKWLKTPLKSLNSDSNRSHGDLPSTQITMYFLHCLSMKLHFPRNLASVREETENIDTCFYLKILVFFYCFFFWFLVLDFTMFYICCNEKKIVVLYRSEDHISSCQLHRW